MRRILGRGLAVLLSVAAVSAPAQPETMRPETVGEGTPEAAPWGVIPVPVSDVRREGTFRPGEPFTYAVRAPHGDVPAAELAACLDGLGWRQAGKGRPDLEIGIDPAARGIVSEEAYRLEIAPRGIAVSARTAAGAFYAVQTLLQLTDDGRAEEIACRTIEDAPRFAYRGFMIDVSRHFRSVEFVKRQIDAMALFKLNRLHMHLTDGAGWRIEIDRYPRLTEFAAWRPYENWQSWWEGDRSYCEADDPRARGGFYTKEEIREIVEYARLRHIEVIPEIEMPGHSEEVTAAYPELGCHGEPYRDGDLCPGNERTFEFLENVLLEVMELFPSEYIHIGGDEAGKSAWRDCAKCRERMRSEGLKDVDELQSYLIHRIERFLNAHGRRLLGWDEILEGELAPGRNAPQCRRGGGICLCLPGIPFSGTRRQRARRWLRGDGTRGFRRGDSGRRTGFHPLRVVLFGGRGGRLCAAAQGPLPAGLVGRDALAGIRSGLSDGPAAAFRCVASDGRCPRGFRPRLHGLHKHARRRFPLCDAEPCRYVIHGCPRCPDTGIARQLFS